MGDHDWDGWMKDLRGRGKASTTADPLDQEPSTPLLMPTPYTEPEALCEAIRRMMMRVKRDSLEVGNAAREANSYTIFERVLGADIEEVVGICNKSARGKRAMGAMVGMAVADSVGHMFEFVPIDQKGCSFDPKTLKVVGAYNKFKLKPGQWTDDTSMGLCLADSLIARGVYHGSDIRVRFWNWWYRGYNNAFRKEASRTRSVGLGGNISASLGEIRNANPPARFDSGTEDSGNGSLMRLAAIPIFFHMDFKLVMRMSAESSFTTHPGATAASACAFLGYLIARAITRSPSSKDSAARFLDACVADYVLFPEAVSENELMRLLRGAEPPGSRERCWNWRDPEGPFLLEAVEARGSSYNGYPVAKDYFGSYSMDGLAVALHSMYHTTTFMTALARCVNLLGDADSTGAILGQLAGAFYGMDAIDKRLIQRLRQWDDGEISLRGAMLYAMGTDLAQSVKVRALESQGMGLDADAKPEEQQEHEPATPFHSAGPTPVVTPRESGAEAIREMLKRNSLLSKASELVKRQSVSSNASELLKRASITSSGSSFTPSAKPKSGKPKKKQSADMPVLLSQTNNVSEQVVAKLDFTALTVPEEPVITPPAVTREAPVARFAQLLNAVPPPPALPIPGFRPAVPATPFPTGFLSGVQSI